MLIAHVYIFILAALVLYLTYALLDGLVDDNQAWYYTPAHKFAAFLYFLAVTSLSVSIVRFFLGFRSTRQYFEEIYKDTIADEFEKKFLKKRDFIKSLKPETCDALHYELIKHTADINFKHQSSFFDTMKNKIEPLLGTIHYDWLNINITNTIVREDEDSDRDSHIISVRDIKMCLHTRTSDKYNLGFNLRRLRPMRGFEKSELYELEKFEIGGRQIDQKLAQVADEEDGKDLCSFSLPHFEDVKVDDLEKGVRIHIERKEKLILPINDSIWGVISPDKSLRQITVHCSFNEPVNPNLVLFGIQKEEEGDYTKQSPNNEDPHACFIDNWRGWMLPSHGYVITWD